MIDYNEKYLKFEKDVKANRDLSKSEKDLLLSKYWEIVNITKQLKPEAGIQLFGYLMCIYSELE